MMGHKERDRKLEKNKAKQDNVISSIHPWCLKANNAHLTVDYHPCIQRKSQHSTRIKKSYSVAYTKWIKRQQVPWFRISTASFLSKLPKLKECAEGEREKVLVHKIRQCCLVFDFVTDPIGYERLKSVKRETLNELVEYVWLYKNVLTNPVYTEAFRMFSVNLFRPLPPKKRTDYSMCDVDDEEYSLEPAWPHLELVYELLKEFISSPEFITSLAENFITKKFVFNLLQLFDSEDPRERKCLCIVLHKIYSIFVKLRPYIRQEINYIIYSYIYDNEFHNGIGDLLELVCSGIRGYIVPLKEDNIEFLFRVLMPLHKTLALPTFFNELLSCVLEFLQKDPSLSVAVVKYLLKYWPKTNTGKETRFLDEVSAILNNVTSSELREFLYPLMKQLNTCCKSYSGIIAGKAKILQNFIALSYEGGTEDLP